MGLRVATAQVMPDGPAKRGAARDVGSPVLVLDEARGADHPRQPICDDPRAESEAVLDDGRGGERLGRMARRERIAAPPDEPSPVAGGLAGPHDPRTLGDAP